MEEKRGSGEVSGEIPDENVWWRSFGQGSIWSSAEAEFPRHYPAGTERRGRLTAGGTKLLRPSSSAQVFSCVFEYLVGPWAAEKREKGKYSWAIMDRLGRVMDLKLPMENKRGAGPLKDGPVTGSWAVPAMALSCNLMKGQLNWSVGTWKQIGPV
ncbi:hypothetical protein Droror1_Dr00000340 [Drosera rotundifolia]